MAGARKNPSNAVEVFAEYVENSNATGVLFNFVYDDGVGVSSNSSAFLPLDRDTSQNYTLPFDLYPGRYTLCVYDIEHDGMLSTGVGYPAVYGELTVTSNGKYAKPLYCDYFTYMLIRPTISADSEQ